MTREYIVDLPAWVHKYHQILDEIATADTRERLRELEEAVEGFYRVFGQKTLGWWVFTWAVENKRAHRAYESLKKQIDIRWEHMYRKGLFENTAE